MQDQFELRAKSNLAEVLEREHSILLEGTAPSSFKLSINYLNTDEARPIILKVMKNLQHRETIRSNEAGAFSDEDLASQSMYQETISLEETVGNYIQAQTEAMWKDATAQPEDLFSS